MTGTRMYATAGLLIWVWCSFGAVQGAEPEVLAVMPADAEVVIVTRPLTQVSAKVDAFVRAAQLPIAPPEEQLNVAEMLGGFLGMMGHDN